MTAGWLQDGTRASVICGHFRLLSRLLSALEIIAVLWSPISMHCKPSRSMSADHRLRQISHSERYTGASLLATLSSTLCIILVNPPPDGTNIQTEAVCKMGASPPAPRRGNAVEVHLSV